MRAMTLSLLALGASVWGCAEPAARSAEPASEAMAEVAAVDEAAPPQRYHCRRCGRHLFDADEIRERRPLWDLGEEKAEVYVLKGARGLSGLRRYDASLHEGWYCCRFALMRMVVDKFGTGHDLLAYVGDVVGVPAGAEPPRIDGPVPGQISLGAADFDTVVSRDDGVLRVVKLSARWCPPCRMVDRALAQLEAAGGIDGVEVFEVDVDAEQALAERFAPPSIPMLLFFHGGRQLQVRADRIASSGGGLVGGIPTAPLRMVLEGVRDAARRGETEIALALGWATR